MVVAVDCAYVYLSLTAFFASFLFTQTTVTITASLHKHGIVMINLDQNLISHCCSTHTLLDECSVLWASRRTCTAGKLNVMFLHSWDDETILKKDYL